MNTAFVPRYFISKSNRSRSALLIVAAPQGQPFSFAHCSSKSFRFAASSNNRFLVPIASVLPEPL
jgi:hypothetical protein